MDLFNLTLKKNLASCSFSIFANPDLKLLGNWNNKILQGEEPPVVVVDIDVRCRVNEEHDPRLQSGVKVAKAGNRLVGQVHFELSVRSFLQKKIKISRMMFKCSLMKKQ